MKDALSEARNKIASATSLGSPNRPIGWAALMASKYSGPPGSSGSRFTRSVLIVPGATALTRMPCWAHSTARCFVKPVARNFAGPYVDCRAWPAIPEIEDKHTMEPPPLLNICSMAYLQVKNMPRPSAAITSSQSYELALVWAYEKGQLLINVILGPVTEELYLRGYLLPRLYRFGIWAPLINISLFSLYHYLTRRGMCCPGSSCCCPRVTQSASTGPVSLTNSLPTLLPG
jgi:hypothetical protein